MLVVRNRTFEHQTAEVAVGGDVIETVIVHPDVRDVRRHVLEGLFTTEREKLILPRRIVLEKGHSELETLRPFRPTPRGILALLGKDGRAIGGLPRFVDRVNLLAGEFKDPVDLLLELLRSEFGVDFHNCKRRR